MSSDARTKNRTKLVSFVLNCSAGSDIINSLIVELLIITNQYLNKQTITVEWCVIDGIIIRMMWGKVSYTNTAQTDRWQLLLF